MPISCLIHDMLIVKQNIRDALLFETNHLKAITVELRLYSIICMATMPWPAECYMQILGLQMHPAPDQTCSYVPSCFLCKGQNHLECPRSGAQKMQLQARM